MNYATTDLSNFAMDGRRRASDLLLAWNKAAERGEHLPKAFNDDNVTLVFDSSDGRVYLTNEENQLVYLTYTYNAAQEIIPDTLVLVGEDEEDEEEE